MKNQSFRVGIGSFTYRYKIGYKNCKTLGSMDIFDFLYESNRLGYEGVQICENINYEKLSKYELCKVKEKAKELNLFVEIGMNGLNSNDLKKHIDLAEFLDSNFIRVVIGRVKPSEKKKATEIKEESIQILKKILPLLYEKDITIGIENHFDLTDTDLIEIVKEIDSKNIGLIFDSTNCLGFIRNPYEVLQSMKKYLLSIHLKDYVVKKVEAGYFITGTILGDGWLDIKRVLDIALKANPKLSIILEMTTRRDNTKSFKEVIEWEKDSIEKSTDYLKKVLYSYRSRS